MLIIIIAVLLIAAAFLLEMRERRLSSPEWKTAEARIEEINNSLKAQGAPYRLRIGNQFGKGTLCWLQEIDPKAPPPSNP